MYLLIVLCMYALRMHRYVSMCPCIGPWVLVVAWHRVVVHTHPPIPLLTFWVLFMTAREQARTDYALTIVAWQSILRLAWLQSHWRGSIRMHSYLDIMIELLRPSSMFRRFRISMASMGHFAGWVNQISDLLCVCMSSSTRIYMFLCISSLFHVCMP